MVPAGKRLRTSLSRSRLQPALPPAESAGRGQPDLLAQAACRGPRRLAADARYRAGAYRWVGLRRLHGAPADPRPSTARAVTRLGRAADLSRSEERRVGKECGFRLVAY